jgi:hypothetical protein
MSSGQSPDGAVKSHHPIVSRVLQYRHHRCRTVCAWRVSPTLNSLWLRETMVLSVSMLLSVKTIWGYKLLWDNTETLNLHHDTKQAELGV